MKRLPILATLAVAILAGPHVVLGQQGEDVHRINAFRLLRKRDQSLLSTHSQANKSPRSLQRRGMDSVVAKDGLRVSTATRQQREYQRRFGSLDNDAQGTDPQRLRSRFADQSKVAAAENQRVLRSFQSTENGAWLGQRSNVANPPTPEQMRAYLLARGVDPASIDQQAQQLLVDRRTRRTIAPAATSGPTVSPGVHGRAVDAQQLNRDLAHASSSRAFDMRFENRTHDNGSADYRQMRSRTTRHGVDPRSMNARLGRAQGTGSDANLAPRFGASRVRRR